ncbi:MAG: DUF4259 domain-containing protein [Deltaproteobacteria bacterium]|nr:DUF4259 domain-containing protein [Deltaproteobacteria bacterium]
MGTWAAGPFSNDAALDYVGDAVDEICNTLDAFMEAPAIDEGFDEAFAAVALLNVLSQHTPAAPPEPERVKEWQKAMLECFDAEIDSMQPDAAFKRDHRAALEKAFVDLLDRSSKFWKR